ncbi:MAG: ketopantoate reductase family protein [Paludibacteraceae bacterium]
MKLCKIAILGLGGVGGYYGAKLAKRYENNNEVRIFFIVRGEHLKAIQKRGVHLTTDEEDFYASPQLATDTSEDIGMCDYVIVTTKSYDLHSSINQIKSCIGKDTVILPLLNGGNISKKISELLPKSKVWSGLSYIVSRKTAPGEIVTTGSLRRMVFGCECEDNERLNHFEQLMKNADIDAVWSKNIRESVWKKFYFISVTASLTSYFNVGFNELVETDERQTFVAGFAQEFISVAEKEGISLGKDTLNELLNRSNNLPTGTTTSMHSDFMTGENTEVETLTGEIVCLAHKHNVQTPLYEKVYKELKSRNK